MAVMIRDTRKFPAQRLPYLNRTAEDLFADQMQLKRGNCPNWTDESPADFGVQLLWMNAVLARFLVDHLERVADNCFLATATDREHVRRMCEMLGYTMSEGSAASVAVTFSLEAGHPEFTIPAGTKVSTRERQGIPAVVFETSSARLVAVGETAVTISCVEGQRISSEVVGSSDGTTRQRFRLSRKPVVWQSETIEVFENGAWTAWSRQFNFLDSLGSSHNYLVRLDADGYYWVEFGDGTNGRIPPRGVNNIRASYRRGGGTAGNVAAGSIIELVSTVTYVDSVTNATAASGGTDRETLDHARVFAPWSLQTLARGVTERDLEYLAETYVSTSHGGIAKAKAVTNGGFGVDVMIVPASGGLPSAAFKGELITYLNDITRKPICVAVSVVDPAYVYVDITATVTTLPNYSPSTVVAEVRRRLAAYLSPVYQDPETGLFSHGFGRDLYLSDLYALIDGTTGVDHCTITAPSANVVVDSSKIANIGTINITAVDPSGGTQFFSAENDTREGVK